MVEAEGVAQRDELRRALRRQRARYLAHREHVPLGDRVVGEEAVRLARHPDRSLCHRRADGDGLVAHIHHPSPARLVHVRQLHAGSARSSASTAASSCGFTFPCASVRASSTLAIAATTLPVSPPARASSRKCWSSSSSISVNPPRAWNGCWRRAEPYRRADPPPTPPRNASASSPVPLAWAPTSAISLPMHPSAAATRCATSCCGVTPNSRCANAATMLSAFRATRSEERRGG